MGTITIEKANALFWLGRYIERVYTTTSYYAQLFDIMLDGDKEIYHDYCKKLDIEDYYFNDAHFMMNYLHDVNNPDSIYSNLLRAYDNAIVLRDEITTPVLSYIQMNMNTSESMESSEAPILLLQNVQDYILSFWGALEDDSRNNYQLSKNIIKLGKYVERIDLYYRLGCDEALFNATVMTLNDIYTIVSKEMNLTSTQYIIETQDSKLDIFNKLGSISNLFEVVR